MISAGIGENILADIRQIIEKGRWENMLQAARNRFNSKNSLFLTHSVLVGGEFSAEFMVKSGIPAFASLNQAIEYIQKKRPRFYRRFSVFVTPDYDIKEPAVCLPRYSKFIFMQRNGTFYQLSSRYGVRFGTESVDRFAVLFEQQV